MTGVSIISAAVRPRKVWVLRWVMIPSLEITTVVVVRVLLGVVRVLLRLVVTVFVRLGLRVSMKFMTARKKKLKQQDFAKKKLKVGKTKPKAENSTAVAFKTQSIKIQSQTKEPQKLKFTLSQLTSHSTQIQLGILFLLDAIDSLLGLVKSDLSCFTDQLADAIHGVSRSMMDPVPCLNLERPSSKKRFGFL